MRWEAQVEKALNLPWVEFILRIVMRIKRQETKIVRMQLKSLKLEKIKNQQGAHTRQRQEGWSITEEMSDHMSTTEFQTEDTAGVDKRIEESCAIGAYSQRGTDFRRHGDSVEQGITNSSTAVVGHGSNAIALTGGETRIEE